MVEIVTKNGDKSREATERKFEPFAIAHAIKDTIVNEEPDEAIFRERGVGTIELTRLHGSMYKVKMKFHESSVENTFSFDPIGAQPQGGTTYQGTELVELGGKMGEMAEVMRNRFDMMRFEFAELDASSIGHENLTDYEFGYENSVRLRNIKEAEF